MLILDLTCLIRLIITFDRRFRDVVKLLAFFQETGIRRILLAEMLYDAFFLEFMLCIQMYFKSVIICENTISSMISFIVSAVLTLVAVNIRHTNV